MSQYYFISQLPSLDGLSETMPLPITEERFYELCDRFLNQRQAAIVSRLTLSPSKEHEPSGSALVHAFHEKERTLRLALAAIRAEKRKKPVETDPRTFPLETLTAARTAVDMEDPLEAERYLHQYRLRSLEELRPADMFSDESVYYYGLKLKLLARMRTFDTEKGKAAYQNIYNSIVHGEGQEATP